MCQLNLTCFLMQVFIQYFLQKVQLLQYTNIHSHGVYETQEMLDTYMSHFLQRTHNRKSTFSCERHTHTHTQFLTRLFAVAY